MSGAKVFEDQELPGQWCVEWIDDDGSAKLEVFSGHDAHGRRYATRCGSTAISEKCS